MIKTLKRINLDAMGISVSMLCAIHCAILPLFFASLPLFGLEILHDKAFEYGMIAFAALIGSYALYHGWKKHHHKLLPLVIFLTGLAFLILKEFFVSEELLLLIPAATLIVGAHLLNYVCGRKANHCHTGDCNHEHLLS
jgi:hypothetical protein